MAIDCQEVDRSQHCRWELRSTPSRRPENPLTFNAETSTACGRPRPRSSLGPAVSRPHLNLARRAMLGASKHVEHGCLAKPATGIRPQLGHSSEDSEIVDCRGCAPPNPTGAGLRQDQWAHSALSPPIRNRAYLRKPEEAERARRRRQELGIFHRIQGTCRSDHRPLHGHVHQFRRRGGRRAFSLPCPAKVIPCPSTTGFKTVFALTFWSTPEGWQGQSLNGLER